MTKIIYFITPQSIIKVGSKTTEFIPILGPMAQYTKKAKKVTERSNRVIATLRGIGIMFNYCFGKVGAMSIECILWLGLSTAGGITANPALISGGTEFENMLLDEISDY